MSDVDLILFMGQSNMAGRGDAAQAPRVPDGYGYEFRAVSAPDRLYPISEPFGSHENNPEGIFENMKTGSMVSSLICKFHELTNHVAVCVSASKGGSSINEWQPGGAYLNDAIGRYQSARQWLAGHGYTIGHQFMVWCQGETDGDNAMPADEYTAKTKNMIETMIAAGLERCYFVRIGNHRDDPRRYDTIIEAQTDLCRTYRYATLIATRFDSMAAEGLMKDSFHYLQEGYNKTGTEAGTNLAFHINTGKEPYMYDWEHDCLYFPRRKA